MRRPIEAQRRVPAIGNDQIDPSIAVGSEDLDTLPVESLDHRLRGVPVDVAAPRTDHREFGLGGLQERWPRRRSGAVVSHL